MTQATFNFYDFFKNKNLGVFGKIDTNQGNMTNDEKYKTIN